MYQKYYLFMAQEHGLSKGLTRATPGPRDSSSPFETACSWAINNFIAFYEQN